MILMASGNVWCMATDDACETQPDAHGDTVAMLAAVGIDVTEEGKARARAELERARARHTIERRAALRAQVGLPPVQAA
jgi:hypothetical protein